MRFLPFSFLKKLFSNKNQSPLKRNSPIITGKSPTQEKPEKEQKQEHQERKYFEIFGDLVLINNFKTTVIIILLGIIISLVVLCWNLMNKPPIVIRVMPSGDILSFRNAVLYQNTSGPEVKNFASLFIKFYTAYNYYSYLDDFANAESMMTTKMKSQATQEIQSKGIENYIKTNTLKTSIEIKSITVLKDTPDFIELRLTGRRKLTSYEDSKFNRDEGFDIEISILKTERTEKQPYGLLVDNYKEVQY
jgi:hypothetical protein